jgi:phosphoglycerate dehydrogenase-like enzyme
VRCVVLDDYQGVATAYADWSSLDGVHVETLHHHLHDDEAVVAALAGAEIVVAMRERTPFTAARLARLPDLRLLVTTGMRNASIDLTACAERDITVCGTSSSFRPPAEHTWALIHGLTRHLVHESLALRRGEPWQSTVGSDLRGATLGLVGLGRIGTAVAAVGNAFGMDVIAWSPHLDDARAIAGGARLVAKQELFAIADIVSLHLVLSDETRRIVGAAELALMKPSAYLVNTSRSGLVDTGAMLDALDTRAIAGAGLDVFDEEPLPLDDRLRAHPHVLATPHLGYVTHANSTTFFTEAVEDIAAWLAGEPVRVLAQST